MSRGSRRAAFEWKRCDTIHKRLLLSSLERYSGEAYISQTRQANLPGYSLDARASTCRNCFESMLSSKAKQQELDAEIQRPLLSSAPPASSAPATSLCSPSDPSLLTTPQSISSSNSPSSSSSSIPTLSSLPSFPDSTSLKTPTQSTSTSSTDEQETRTEAPSSSFTARSSTSLSSSLEHVYVEKHFMSASGSGDGNTEDTKQWSELQVFAGVSTGRKGGNSIFRNLKRPRRIVRNILIFGFRGAENFLVYLWIFKDLAWTQTWYYTAFTFGFLSIMAQIILVARSIYDWNFEDIYHQIAQTLWLFANFWAMTGEKYDENFNAHRFGERRDEQSGYMMAGALLWLAVFYFGIRPFNLILQGNKGSVIERYESVGLKSRFSYFNNWRQYEYMHICCWLGKDWSWTVGSKPLWILFTIPTLLLAVDFAYVSSKYKVLVIDHAHYLAQLLWVFGNIVWAGGDLFYDDDADPIPLYIYSPSSFRWWASWTLVCAFLPIVWLYVYYIPYMYYGKHRSSQHDRDKIHRNLLSGDHTNGPSQSNSHIEDDYMDGEADMDMMSESKRTGENYFESDSVLEYDNYR